MTDTMRVPEDHGHRKDRHSPAALGFRVLLSIEKGIQ